MSKTKSEMSRDVLCGMGVYAPEDSPSAADASQVESIYDRKLAEWRDDGLVFWTNTDRTTAEIPDRVYSVLLDLMENEARNAFKGDNPPAQKRQTEVYLLGRLRRLMAKKPSGETTTYSSY